jgi:hypothetical protein
MKMNEDSWQHIGNWSINFSWQQEWDQIPTENLVFFSSPEAELDAIDKAFEERESDTDLAVEMLKSIGINV